MKNEHEIVPYHVTDLSGRRTLVLAPHPDDETIGCGGSIARHCLAEDWVKVVFLTDGSRGDISGRMEKEAYIRLRQNEATKACQCLGVSDVEFWNYGDRQLADADDARNRLIELLSRFEPELVYLPSPLELHPDHRAAACLFWQAISGLTLDCEVAFYEISQPMIVNTLVDVTFVLDMKKQALKMYESQLSEMNYDDICMALSRFRSLTLPKETTHAEGFCMDRASRIRGHGLFYMFHPDEEKLYVNRHCFSGAKKKQRSWLHLLMKKILRLKKG